MPWSRRNIPRMRKNVIMAESAAQLFARLGAKQSLGTLGLPLFSSLPSPGGVLCPGDVVEMIGEEGSGKTEILLNITAQCVLPGSWRGREIGGKEVEVVWVCTDFKFDVLRLVAILEGKVCDLIARGEKEKAAVERCFQFPSTHDDVARLTELQQTEYSASSKDLESDRGYRSLITSCLSRVHIINCNSSMQLGVTLQSLRQLFLPAHPDVCALVLDNVAEFYWIDRAEAGSVRGSEVKQSVWVNALHRLVQDHHVVVFAARPLLFAQTTTTSQPPENRGQGKGSFYSQRILLPTSLGSDNTMCLQWKQMVKYRFLLTSSTIQRVFPPSATSCIHKFIVSSQGIRFSS